MKTTRRTILASSILALTASATFAQTWTGAGDGVSWNQLANWTALPVSQQGQFINFTNAGVLVTNQNLANPFILGYLQQNTTGNLTIGGNALNFQDLSGQATITLSALNSFITAPVILTSATQIFADNLLMSGGVSGAGEFRMGSGIVTLSGAGTWTGGTNLGNNGNGTLRIAAANALSGNVSFGFIYASVLEFVSPTAMTFGGTFSNGFVAGQIVRQSGPGTLLLSGASPTFFGAMQAAGGILQSGGVSALGNGTVQVQSGGTLQMAATNSLSGPQNIAVAAGGTLDAGGFVQSTAVLINNNGTVSLPTGSDVTVGGGATWTGGSTGAGALTFNGFITLNAGTALTHTGGTRNVGGFVQINTSNALPDTGLLRVSGGFVNHTGTDTVDTVLVDGGNLQVTTLTATGNVDLQSGSFTGTNITTNAAFTKTTAGTGVISGVTLGAGGTVSAGVLDINGPVNGALTNNATTNLNFGATLTGATNNTSALNVSGGTLAGTVANSGTITANNGNISAAITNNGTVDTTSFSNAISGNISGPGNFTSNAAITTLSGVNSYLGGSVIVGSFITGTTDSIQGAWALTSSTLNFAQATFGTMAGNITGDAVSSIQLFGTGKVTLSGNNTFGGGVFLSAAAAHLGFGSNTAAGTGGLIQGGDFKLSAEGGARTIANPLLLALGTTEFTGGNNLTFTNATAKTLSGTAQILHTSTASTVVGGTFLGQNTTTINVNAGLLQLGALVNNGFRMDGAINVASGATLQMVSNSPVKLGPTNLNGGTLIAPSGVAVPTGLALTATGTIQGRVSSESGSLIEATGALSMGDATNFAGYFSNGELRTQQHSVTLLDKNQAVLGSITEIGNGANPGALTATNGVFVDFGRAITGWGTVAGTNALAQATIINGDAEGTSFAQPLDFTGYVKGIGDFSNVIFSGTFSPGLSPAITPVNNVIFSPTNTLIMEIGGLTPGSQHDQLDITGLLGLNGLLDVDLINGFNPSFGDTFNIFDGTTTGTFSSFSFPTLGGGLSWDTSDLYSQGDLKIVPEPATASLLLLAGASVLARRRRR